jgi:hypothetical protein
MASRRRGYAPAVPAQHPERGRERGKARRRGGAGAEDEPRGKESPRPGAVGGSTGSTGSIGEGDARGWIRERKKPRAERNGARTAIAVIAESSSPARDSTTLTPSLSFGTDCR